VRVHHIKRGEGFTHEDLLRGLGGGKFPRGLWGGTNGSILPIMKVEHVAGRLCKGRPAAELY